LTAEKKNKSEVDIVPVKNSKRKETSNYKGRKAGTYNFGKDEGEVTVAIVNEVNLKNQIDGIATLDWGEIAGKVFLRLQQIDPKLFASRNPRTGDELKRKYLRIANEATPTGSGGRPSWKEAIFQQYHNQVKDFETSFNPGALERKGKLPRRIPKALIEDNEDEEENNDVESVSRAKKQLFYDLDSDADDVDEDSNEAKVLSVESFDDMDMDKTSIITSAVKLSNKRERIQREKNQQRKRSEKRKKEKFDERVNDFIDLVNAKRERPQDQIYSKIEDSLSRNNLFLEKILGQTNISSGHGNSDLEDRVQGLESDISEIKMLLVNLAGKLDDKNSTTNQSKKRKR